MTPIPTDRAALPAHQGVLLWSMRAWVLGLARKADMAPRIHAAFAGIDSEDAAPGLIGFMETLDAGGIRSIDVAPMCRPTLSADERLLIGVFRAVQDAEPAAAATVLRGMVAAGSVAAALDQAEDVAAVLLDAGHGATACRPARRADAAPAASLH